MDTNFKRVEKGREEREKALAEVRERECDGHVCVCIVCVNHHIHIIC